MASKIDVTLKRFNGSDEDMLYPTTHMGQVYTDSTETKTLATFLGETYINLNQKGAANGVATLDIHQKLTASQLPVYLFGGMSFAGVLNLSTTKTIDNIMEAASPGNTPDKLSAVGEYLQVSADGILTQGSTWTGTVLPPGDEGDYDLSDGIELEATDWVVVDAVDHDAKTVTLAIINNKYKNASMTASGIVKLSDATNALVYNITTNPNGLVASSIDVITEGFLEANMKHVELNNAGSAGAPLFPNAIAGTGHLHDGRYYTETEIANFFGGSSAITGYNKTNWDAAYNDKINSASFNTGDGILTLTQQDGGSVTVDLDGRYVETLTAAQVDTTTGITIGGTGKALTIAHANTSTQTDITGTNGNVIRSVGLDTYGHIVSMSSYDLDGRYYTETEINNWISGTSTLNGNTYVPIIYGTDPTSTIVGALLIDID